MSDHQKDEIPIPDESPTSDSESDSDSSDFAEDSSDTECETDGTVGDDLEPFRFIVGEDAQAKSLDGIAYGIDEKGHYFVIGKDGDTVGGLMVHALIERNIKDGILLPISKLGAGATTADTMDEK